MASNAVSRAPVEIWRKIIQMVILGLDILNPDPYDVPPSKLFARAVYMHRRETYPLTMSDERYREFISQITNLRLVCVGWNGFAHPFLHCVISLSYTHNGLSGFDRSLGSEVSPWTIKMLRTPFPPHCSCRFGEKCFECGLGREQGSGHLTIDKPESIGVVESIDFVKDSTITTLLDSKMLFPNLRGLSIFWGSGGFTEMHYLRSSRFDEICMQMPYLVYLEIFIYGDEAIALPLNFPHLKSLNLGCYLPGQILSQKWNLPSLKSFILSASYTNIEDTIVHLKDNAPRLTFLSLIIPETFNSSQKSNIWAIFPHLVAFRSCVDFFVANLPPPTHPLRHFMSGAPRYDSLYRASPDPNGIIASKLRIAAAGWADCQSLFTEELLWIEAFQVAIKFVNTGISRDIRPRLTAVGASEHLRVGLELEEVGVRYEDTYGLSFTEACDRFCGADPRGSVKAYVDAVRTELEKAILFRGDGSQGLELKDFDTYQAEFHSNLSV